VGGGGGGGGGWSKREKIAIVKKASPRRGNNGNPGGGVDEGSPLVTREKQAGWIPREARSRERRLAGGQPKKKRKRAT